MYGKLCSRESFTFPGESLENSVRSVGISENTEESYHRLKKIPARISNNGRLLGSAWILNYHGDSLRILLSGVCQSQPSVAHFAILSPSRSPFLLFFLLLLLPHLLHPFNRHPDPCVPFLRFWLISYGWLDGCMHMQISPSGYCRFGCDFSVILWVFF